MKGGQGEVLAKGLLGPGGHAARERHLLLCWAISARNRLRELIRSSQILNKFNELNCRVRGG